MKLTGSAALGFAFALAPALADKVAVPSTGTTSLRLEAEKQGVLIGSGAINPAYLYDPQFATVLAEQFNSLSPENELKWNFMNPSKGVYNWTAIDRLVDFADENDMVVKGHGLVSSCCNPDYVANISNAKTLRDTMKSHFNAVMTRYHGKLNRWDVVSEAMEAQGTTLDANNFFYKILGPDWVAESFRIAHAADPTAKLFLNENLVESLPDKRKGFLELVSKLIADGVPVHGIALQMHVTLQPLVPGVIKEMTDSYAALGLETVIAEFDVHTLDADLQTEIYSSSMKEALAAGIKDISFWGFTDKHLYTWIPGAKPLMFDEEYQPKGAFYATHDALVESECAS